MHKTFYAGRADGGGYGFSSYLVNIGKSLPPGFKKYSDQIDHHVGAVYRGGDLICLSDIRRPRHHLAGIADNFKEKRRFGMAHGDADAKTGSDQAFDQRSTEEA